MRLRDQEMPLDPEAERELDAVDRALAGDPVDPDLRGWEELAVLLADQRAEPGEDWSAELDRRVAARFRGRQDGPGNSLRTWLAGIRPGRALAPAGALATLAIVVVVGVSTLGGDGSEEGTFSSTEITTEDAGGGAALESAPEVGGDALELNGTPLSAPDGRTFQRDSGAAEIAPGTENRRIERDVTLQLSTRPEGVREASDEVIAITRSLDGIVASSQVTEAGRSSRGTLQLVIPTRNLDLALDRLTEVASVESLNEATVDVTRPFVSAQDRLRDAEAQRRELLEALGNATSEVEAEALRLQLADVRREISRAESAFENISRRATLSDVSVTIVGDPDSSQERTLGDWLDDAVDVLRDVAGVLLVSAAILGPLGLLAAVGWLIVTRARRRRRERALDS